MESMMVGGNQEKLQSNIFFPKPCNVIAGSLSELRCLIAAGNYRGSIGDLCAAFPDEEVIRCHNRGEDIPISLSMVLTPHNTHPGAMSHQQRDICSIECEFACQSDVSN